MMTKIFFLCLLISLKETYSLPFGFDTIGSAAGKFTDGVGSVAGGVAGGVVDGSTYVANAAGKATDVAVNKTGTVLGKVHEGVFDIENGFVNGVDEVIGTPVDLNEVSFYLATSKNVENPTKLDFYKPDGCATKTGKIYILIHGWTSSRNATFYGALTEILIERNPENRIVQVDWSNPASGLYSLAAFQTEPVGNFVGIFVNRLVTEYKVPLDNIVLIGHSLGGQISGWAGKKFRELSGQKLPRIIALDPAGPLFILRPDSRRLNKDDAKVVMVIHSDGGKLGFPFQCGTIDFFPNGGSNQPGCWKVNLAKVSTYVDPVTCDHSRGWDFFIEAVNVTGSFMAKKCESYSKFEDDQCEGNKVVSMGDLETTAEGSFYLDTEEEKPYNRELGKKEEKLKKNLDEKIASGKVDEKVVDALNKDVKPQAVPEKPITDPKQYPTTLKH